MDRVHIPWYNDTSYDDWDHIAQTLYQEIVIDSLQWSLEI